MHTCPSDTQFALYRAGGLSATEAEAISAHARTCHACRAALTGTSSLEPTGNETVGDPNATDAFIGPERERSPRAPTTTAELPRIPGYEVLIELGRGGMGVVYKARHVRLGRVVALKMILPSAHAGSEEVARFHAEAQAVARLQHPNIVQVHEVGEHEGQPFFSLEFVEGGNLAGRQAGAAQQPREAAAMLETLARAVQYAHEQGIVHRDLKPANVLLGAAGAPKIADFGLAKRLDTDSGQTKTGQIMGSPSYMAPEQAEGQIRAIGPATDVYALGAILYELLTGRPPFRGASIIETLEQVRNVEPPSPSQLQPKVPRDLDTICVKCLQKDPAKRFVSAGALAGDLRHFLFGEPIEARPIGRAERLYRWARRNPSLAGLWLVLVVGVVVSSALAVGFYIASEKADRSAKAATENENKEREARRFADQTILDMYTASGLTASDQGKPIEAMLWFATAADMAKGDQEREFVNRVRVHNWVRRLPSLVRVWQGTFGIQQESQRITFHPGGNYLLAIRHDDKACVIWRLDTDRVLELPGIKDDILDASWNPAGDRLALGRSDCIEILSFPECQRLAHIASAEPVQRVAFSPSGEELVVAGRKVRFWDCRVQQFGKRELDHPQLVTRLAFSPDGKQLVTECEDNQARAFAVTPGDSTIKQPLISVPYAANRGAQGGRKWFNVAFADSGRSLVTIHDSALCWWNIASGKSEHKLPAPAGVDAWNLLVGDPEGHLIVAGRSFNTGYPARLRLVDSSRRLVGANIDHPNMILNAVFSRDGAKLLTVGLAGAVKLWSVPDGELMQSLWLPVDVRNADMSPDGRLIAVVMQDGTMMVWTLPEKPTGDWCLSPVTRSWWTRTTSVLSHDGKHFVEIAETREHPFARIRVHDVVTGRPVGPSLALRRPADAAAFDPQDRYLVVLSRSWGGRDDPGTVSCWDWRKGEPVFPPMTTKAEPVKALFTPDSEWLLVLCADHTMQRIAVSDGTVRNTWPHPGRWDTSNILHEFGGLKLTPDGRSFITTRAGKSGIMDLASGQVQALERPDGGDWSDVDFSPDGRHMASTAYFSPGQSGREAGEARVWDWNTGQPVGKQMLHPNWVYQVRFSPDGKQIATTCRDGLARLWDWRTGQLVCPPLEHPREVMTARFSPDGHWLYTCGTNHEVRVWDARTGKPVSPPVPLESEGIAAEVARNGQYLLVTTMQRTQGIRLTDYASPPDEPAAKYLRLYCEVMAGKRIETGGGPANLTIDEMLERWKDLRRAVPDFPPFPEASDPRAARAYSFQRGEKQIQNGDWAAARAQFTRVLAREPNNSAAWYYRGYATSELGDQKAAIADYSKAIELNPANEVAFYRRGLAHAQLGQWAEVAADSSKVIELIPGNPDPWFQRGGARAKLGKVNEAIADFVKGLEASPDCVAGCIELCDLYEQCGDWTDAKAQFTKIIERAPRNEAAWHFRGNAKSQLGAYKAALDDYDKALELKPTNETALFRRGLAHANLGEWDTAILDYTACLKLRGDLDFVWNLRGIAYYRLRQWEKAAADATRAIELNPNNRLYRMNRGLDYAEWGRWQEAAVDFQEADKLGSKDVVPRVSKALALLAAGDVAGYQNACASLLQDFANADDTAVAARLVWTCCTVPQSLTDYSPAVALAEKTVNNARTYLSLRALGAALYRARKFESATQRLEEAIALQEQSPAAWLFLAMANHSTAHAQEAARWFKKADQWIEQARKGTDLKGGGAELQLWLRLDWTERLVLQRLRQEAVDLLPKQ